MYNKISISHSLSMVEVETRKARIKKSQLVLDYNHTMDGLLITLINTYISMLYLEKEAYFLIKRLFFHLLDLAVLHILPKTWWWNGFTWFSSQSNWTLHCKIQNYHHFKKWTTIKRPNTTEIISKTFSVIYATNSK